MTDTTEERVAYYFAPVEFRGAGYGREVLNWGVLVLFADTGRVDFMLDVEDALRLRAAFGDFDHDTHREAARGLAAAVAVLTPWQGSMADLLHRIWPDQGCAYGFGTVGCGVRDATAGGVWTIIQDLYLRYTSGLFCPVTPPVDRGVDCCEESREPGGIPWIGAPPMLSKYPPEVTHGRTR